MAINHMLDRMGGMQVRIWSVSAKYKKKLTLDQSAREQGYKFIRDFGPRSNNRNQPMEWADEQVHMPQKKKKVTVKGKTACVKPHYTRICSHALPDGQTMKVVAGTQIIDRFWQHVRTYSKNVPRKVGSVVLHRKIRAAQWTYLHKSQNLRKATADMLADLCA